MFVPLAPISTDEPACLSLPAPMAELGTVNILNVYARRTPSGMDKPASLAVMDKSIRELLDAAVPMAPSLTVIDAFK